MSSIRNEINIKELMDTMQEITNQAILYNKEPLEKAICTHKKLAFILFGNALLDSKRIDNIRKIGTDESRNLSEENLLTFIDNFYEENEFTNYAGYCLEDYNPEADIVDKNHGVDPYSINEVFLRRKISEFYFSINPYPWVSFVLSDSDKQLLDPKSNLMMMQLFYLLVYTYCCQKTKEKICNYDLLKKIPNNILQINDSANNTWISFISKNKPKDISHIYLLDEESSTYNDIVKQLFPEYGFWQKDAEAIQQFSPFSFTCSEEKIILSTLQPNDLIIINNSITNNCLEMLQRTHCYIIYAFPDQPSGLKGDFLKSPINEWIPLILPTLTDDAFELSCLCNGHYALGTNWEIYRLVHAYYTKFKESDSTIARGFLKGICNSRTLDELSQKLKPYNKEEWKYTYKTSKDQKPSGRYISKAISDFYRYNLQPDRTELCELLRLLCQIREVKPEINLKDVCRYFKLEDACDELLSLEWIDPLTNHIPLIIAHSVTYGITMSNRAFDFYLDTIILQLYELMLGHTTEPIDIDLFSILIKIIHQDLLVYIPARTNVPLKELKKRYLRNYTRKISEDKKISIQSGMYFGEHGYFPDDKEKYKLNHHTHATIAHKTILTNFYYGILIFCYEYRLNDFARDIFTKTDLSKVLFMTSDEYEKTLESRLLLKYYELLFVEQYPCDVQQRMYKPIWDYANTIPQNSDSKDIRTFFSELKIPLFMYLRVLVFHMQSAFIGACVNELYWENYKNLVISVSKKYNQLDILFSKLSMNNLCSSELATLYVHCKLIALHYKIDIDDIPIESSSTFYKTHLYIFKLFTAQADSSEQLSELGILAPVTCQLIDLIKNFSQK